jgi:hypothetical protein
MTKDDLLTLMATNLSHPVEPATGGYLFCHSPHEGEFAYLGRVYDPVSTKRAQVWFADLHQPGHPYFSFLTEVANGLRVASISLYGVIGELDRSIGPGVGQPISLDYGNRFERPGNLDDSDVVVGGIVGWSSRGDFVMDEFGRVRLVHTLNGDDVADEWLSLEAMLRAELPRLARNYDAEGRLISTHTDLMHPSGRRWETEIEPGTARH